VSSKSSVVCDACQQGKNHQLPFSVSQHITTAPLKLIYSDVWSPAQTSVSGHNYYVSFVHAYSRFTWLYLIKRKSDVFDVFLQFQSHVEHLLHHNFFCMFNLTGVVSILSYILSFRILVSLIGSLVHIHINKMVVLSVNTVILLRLASLFLLMHLFLFDTGM
jgi:hypothetical protein